MIDQQPHLSFWAVEPGHQKTCRDHLEKVTTGRALARQGVSARPEPAA